MRGRGKRRSLPDSEAGLTLTEVILVVVIIGVLATVATHGFNRAIAHWDLVTAARTMVSDLRSARDLAMTRGTDTVVWIYDYDDQEPYYMFEKSDGTWESVYLPKRVQFAYLSFFATIPSEVYKVQFGASGTPSGQTGSAYLKNLSQNEYRKIAVMPVTGRVRITEEAPP
ncbi:MAG: GspH/FimT family protein [Bacillota bacterium]